MVVLNLALFSCAQRKVISCIVQVGVVRAILCHTLCYCPCYYNQSVYDIPYNMCVCMECSSIHPVYHTLIKSNLRPVATTSFPKYIYMDRTRYMYLTNSKI